MRPSQHAASCAARISEISAAESSAEREMRYKELATIFASLADMENKERIREHHDQSTIEHALAVLDLADFRKFDSAIINYLGEILENKKAAIAREAQYAAEAADRRKDDYRSDHTPASNWSKHDADLRDFDRTEANAINGRGF